MLRAVGGVVLGYLVIAALVFLCLSLAYVILGGDLAFQPETYEVSWLWIFASFILSFAAALVGGLVCAAVARGKGAVAVLAGIVLVLGLAMAMPELGRPEIAARRPDRVGNFEAFQNAEQPAWVMVVLPFLGAAGVLLGGALSGRR